MQFSHPSALYNNRKNTEKQKLGTFCNFFNIVGTYRHFFQQVKETIKPTRGPEELLEIVFENHLRDIDRQKDEWINDEIS